MTAGEPNWDDIRIFLAVARTGSLTEAARSLGVSQPTVSRRLQALEAEAGARLFDRLPNRLEPTALGHALAEAATGMAEGAGAVVRRLRQGAGDGGVPVSITATSSVALFVTGHLPSLLADTGRMIAIENSRSRASLAWRQADIALRMRRMPEEGDLRARRIGRIGFALYAARDYAARSDLAGRPGLEGLHFIGLPETRRSPSQSAWLDAVAQPGTIICRLGEVFLRHQAVADGVGISLLPCFLGDADARLLRVGHPPAELREDIYLMLHADLRGDPGIRAMAEALAGLFSREGAALEG